MKTLWLILLLLGVSGLCRADRAIVYAARYYAPPGSHRTSHVHIYRINPDGTGTTQLTFGAGDEDSPQWSPDGRQILFAAYPANSDAGVRRFSVRRQPAEYHKPGELLFLPDQCRN